MCFGILRYELITSKKNNLLTSAPWKMTSVIEIVNDEENDLFLQADNCAIDDILIFNDNNSGMFQINETCDEDDEDKSFTWKLNEEENIVELTITDEIANYEIIELTEYTFKFKKMEEDERYLTYTFSH